MPTEQICSECGAPLPTNAPGNRCPKCLLEFALEETGQDDASNKPVVLPQSEMPAEQIGTVIGRYKLLQQIGEGGFGVVFMAEQTEPVQRKVALKVIKAGMDTREIIARFEAERQALALMDHPNIAQVLDGGTTVGGRPYFVMELVRGLPITEYCDQANLSTRERLELFIKVCRAVQHAHQKGVIHRDLKPSNVLVTLHDGEPVPKVIDFGVAKALGQKLTEKTLFTRFEQMVGTPAYMSPEQAALGGLDIDTRSDVYSLGVLLYELLTGVTPLDTETLRRFAMDEIRRMIRETDPPKPSTRVATLGGRLIDVAKHRRAEPTALNRLLRGDLDWITMKALEKDRQRRYETVNGLVMDVARHLKNEPVVARPPSALYRLQKIVQRNRIAFATGVAVTVALVLGVIISTWQAVRATRAEREQSRLRQRAQAAQASEVAQRQRAEDNAAESRTRLVRQYVANGNRLVQERDFLGALPWFAQALKEDRNNTERARIHRLRLSLTMQQCPKLTQLYSHGAGVNHAEFSPDGKSILSASADHTARIWDAVSGEPRAAPLQHTGAVNHAAFSADGRWVVTASADHTAQVWDAATGKPRAPSLRHTARVNYAAFSPDASRVLTVSDDKTAQLWDAAAGQPIASPLQHQSPVNHGSFSADGRLVATACEDGTVVVWDVRTGQPVAPALNIAAANRRSRTYLAQFSPAGGQLLTVGDEAILWDPATAKPMSVLKHQEVLCYACFSPDGRRVVTASYDSTARVWDTATGSPITPLLRHDHQVWHASFSPDGAMLVTASMGCNLRLWSADTGELLTGIIRQSGQVGSASFSPDGRQVLVASQSRTVGVWDIAGAEPLVSHLATPSVVYETVFSPDGRLAILLGLSGGASVWDVIAAKPCNLFGTNLSFVRSAQFSADGRRLALGSSDGSAVVWELADGKPALPPLHHNGPINHVEFSLDGRQLVTASGDGWARVWDLASGQCVSQMAHQGPVAYASFTPDDNQVVTATVNRRQALLADGESGGRGFLADPRSGLYGLSNVVRLWDARSGQPAALPIHIPAATSLILFSSDRSRVVNSYCAVNEKQDAAYANTPRPDAYLWDVRADVGIWEVKSGRKLSPDLFPGTADCLYAAFSPDGSRLVTTSVERMARVWDGYTGKSGSPVLQHRHEVYYASFSPDSRLVATASHDGTVRLWETDTGEPVGPPLNHGFAVRSAAAGIPVRVFFAPDGQRLVSCTSDGTTHVWELTREAHPLNDDPLLMAQLLANATIDETGSLALFGWQPKTPLEQQWRTLLTKYPSIMAALPLQVSAWNRRRAKQYYQEAHVKERDSKFIEAINDLSQAIALNPDYNWAYNKRGQIFLLLGEYEKAAADFHTEIERFPDFPLGYSDLAALYVIGPRAFRNPEKALPLALKGAELSKYASDQLNNVGVAYYRLGQFEKAIETLEKCVSIGRPGPSAYDYFFLVMAYSRLGQAARAEDCYAKAIESWKNHPESLNTLNQRELQEIGAEAQAVLHEQKSKH